MADGVPAQVAVAVARGEGVDDVLAVVVLPAAPVRVPVLPCMETGAAGRAGAGLGSGLDWAGARLGWGWDQD